MEFHQISNWKVLQKSCFRQRNSVTQCFHVKFQSPFKHSVDHCLSGIAVKIRDTDETNISFQICLARLCKVTSEVNVNVGLERAEDRAQCTTLPLEDWQRKKMGRGRNELKKDQRHHRSPKKNVFKPKLLNAANWVKWSTELIHCALVRNGWLKAW